MELLEPLPKRKAFNLKKEIGRYLKKWPWILLSMLVFFIAAKLYLRYTNEQYLTKSSVKIENLQKGSIGELQNLGTKNLIAEKGAGIEIPILLSRPILYDVVKTLNTDVVFVRKGKVKDQEVYRDAPVEIKILTLKSPAEFAGRTYTLTQEGNLTFKLASADGKIMKFPYNAVCNVDFGTFIVKPKAGFSIKEPLQVTFLNAVKVAEGLQGSIIIVENELNKDILELSHKSTVPDKSQAILNTAVAQYNTADLQNKREQSKVSLDFIDERLSVLTQDLGNIENQKEGYKKQNQITDLETQAQINLQTANENTKELLGQATQLELVNSVLEVANRSGNQLLPTNIGMPSGLDQAIAQYNDLVITKNKTMRQATGANPAVVEMNREIASLKTLIKDNLVKSRQSIQMNMARINGQINTSKANISKFPTQEKIFRNIDRQQNLKESLYLYLLQKKEETSIAMAVTMPKVRVINPAYTISGPVEPQSRQILLGSLLAGLLLPVLVMYGVFALDTQVKSKNDITDQMPDLAVLAEIPTVGKDESDLIGKNDLSVYAEAFRILTSNLKFMVKKQDIAPVFLFTSSVKGEGKTTISINAAMALASNKRIIFIGADLRNPQLGRYVPKTHLGLSDYLAQDDPENYRKFIRQSDLHANLDIMQSGSIPPNPTDLLEDEKLGLLLDRLKKEYDYILIDSAPLMMVSDTFHILRFADVVIYVVRANYTEKELLNYAKTVAEDENVKKMAFVLNDVHKNEMRYGYGGKYSYGYTAEKERRGFFDFLKKNN